MDEAFLALLLADPVLSERVGRRIQWGVQPPGETATRLYQFATCERVPALQP